ncbi:MAG: hypothetical protein PHQ34_02145 [Methanothrix sp.]|nr:hypothetical protein [Methanothrix sp.]
MRIFLGAFSWAANEDPMKEWTSMKIRNIPMIDLILMASLNEYGCESLRIFRMFAQPGKKR